MHYICYYCLAPDGAPFNIAYNELNLTAINVKWSSDATLVNGFTLRIFSNEESTSYQVSDPNARELVIEGVQPETNYTVELRAYYELLGTPSLVFPIHLPCMFACLLNFTIIIL